MKRKPTRIEAKCGHHFLQNPFPVLIRSVPICITSGSPTTLE